jgi:hypothetical protein
LLIIELPIGLIVILVMYSCDWYFTCIAGSFVNYVIEDDDEEEVSDEDEDEDEEDEDEDEEEE